MPITTVARERCRVPLRSFIPFLLISYAVTVLSNHMHLLMRSGEGRSGELLADLGQYKSYVARQANRILGRTGSFWAREGFDHWCRDEAKVISVARYICENPVKAGLVKSWADWPWTRSRRRCGRACRRRSG